MPRFRLRYQASDLELPNGEFVIGRSREANLALDDALVSRRHAALRVTEDGATVEDLGSRNGVLLNGEKVTAPMVLRHLDRLTVGAQEMILLEVGRHTDPPDLPLPCHQCGTPLENEDRFCRRCGAPSVGRRAPATTLDLDRYGDDDEDFGSAGENPEEVTRRAVGINLVAAIVEKSLAMGRFDEAERVVEKHLHRMLQLAMKGSKPPPDMLRRATDYAITLASGLERASWIDWVFQVHGASQSLVPSATVDELHQLVRRIRYRDGRALRHYLETTTAQGRDFTPAEKFVIKRLEALERVISA